MKPQGCATVIQLMCSIGSSFDICNYIIIIYVYIYSKSSGYVMQYQSLSEYLIIAEESYVISVTCRCSIGTPIWRGTGGTKIPSSAVYCKDNGTSCGSTYIETYQGEGYFVFTDLTNYIVNESTILQCGNEIYNFAQAIAIVITQGMPYMS